MNIMTKRGTQDNIITYEHYCDTVADLANIPKEQSTLGSVAVVVNGADGLGAYIANTHHEWVPLFDTGGSSSSGNENLLYICSSGEISSAGLPEIENPVENQFYLVPSQNSSSDMYDEWIYLGDSGWEKFGSGGGTIGSLLIDWEISSSGELGYIENKPAIWKKPENAIIENYFNNVASGGFSHAEGVETTASSQFAHAEGYQTVASGTGAHAEGDGCSASGYFSHAEGLGTTASGDNSHSEGYYTKAIGPSAHAEGCGSLINNSARTYNWGDGIFETIVYGISSGAYSHTEGCLCTALNDSAHAEGDSTVAKGVNSHAEGYLSGAKGLYAHAEGYDTRAVGKASHSEGSSSVALGQNAHAEGEMTFAYRMNQHVFGAYNVPEDGPTTTRGIYIEIVGNGAKTNSNAGTVASNARTLDWSGNEWLAGGLTISSGHSLTIGSTSLSEAKLQTLLSLTSASGVNF